MLLLAEGMQRPAYVIEDHGDGNFDRVSSSAPAAFSGMVMSSRATGRLSRRQTHRIDPEHRAIWSGTGDLLKKKKPNEAETMKRSSAALSDGSTGSRLLAERAVGPSRTP